MEALIYQQVGVKSEARCENRAWLLLKNTSGSGNSLRPFQDCLQGTAASQAVLRGFYRAGSQLLLMSS